MDFCGFRALTFITVENGSTSPRVASGAATAPRVALAGGILDSNARFRPRTCAMPLAGFVTLSLLIMTSSTEGRAGDGQQQIATIGCEFLH
jgi:hypothetical protein